MSNQRRGDQFDLFANPDGLTPDEEMTKDLIIAVASSRDEKAVRFRESMEQYERMIGKTPAILAMARMLNRSHSGIEHVMNVEAKANRIMEQRAEDEALKNTKKLREGLAETYAN